LTVLYAGQVYITEERIHVAQDAQARKNGVSRPKQNKALYSRLKRGIF